VASPRSPALNQGTMTLPCYSALGFIQCSDSVGSVTEHLACKKPCEEVEEDVPRFFLRYWHYINHLLNYKKTEGNWLPEVQSENSHDGMT